MIGINLCISSAFAFGHLAVMPTRIVLGASVKGSATVKFPLELSRLAPGQYKVSCIFYAGGDPTGTVAHFSNHTNSSMDIEDTGLSVHLATLNPYEETQIDLHDGLSGEIIFENVTVTGGKKCWSSFSVANLNDPMAGSSVDVMDCFADPIIETI